jgi:RNA polymerase sigma factor (sigma-70 family)
LTIIDDCLQHFWRVGHLEVMSGEGTGVGAEVAPSPQAFDVFYREQWAKMVRLAWLMTGSREVAEDLVQDAFVQVGAKWASVQKPHAYLRVTVTNAVRTHARRERRQRSLPDERVQPVLPGELDETWHLLDRLPDRQRQALVLRFYADLPFTEVAEELRCRVGTAQSLVHRGLARMKEFTER